MKWPVKLKTYYRLRDISYILGILTCLAMAFYNASHIDVVRYVAVTMGLTSIIGFLVSEFLSPTL